MQGSKSTFSISYMYADIKGQEIDETVYDSICDFEFKEVEALMIQPFYLVHDHQEDSYTLSQNIFDLHYT